MKIVFRMISYLKKRWLFLSITIILCCFLFWVLSSIGRKYAITQIDSELSLGLTSTSALLSQILSKPLMLARLAAKNATVQSAIQSKNTPEKEELLIQLMERYKQATGSLIVSLLADDGTLIAGDRKVPRNYYGQDFSFRPYLKKALTGKESSYFAIGVTDNLAGYYIGVPAHDATGTLSGALMVKYLLDAQALSMVQYEYMFLVSPDGVILLASNPDWTCKTLYPISPRRRNQLKKSRQFGKFALEELHLQWRTEQKEVFFQNKTFIFEELSVTDDGWKLVMFKPDTRVFQYQSYLLSLAVSFLLLIGSGFLFLSRQKQIATLLKQYNLELEKTVSARTRELDVTILNLKTEIADRKNAERALKISEEKFRQFFEHANIGFAITSHEKGWIEVNHHLCEILGYSDSELYTKTWDELTHPDDLPADLEQFDKILKGKIDVYELDKRFYRKNKELLDIHLTVSCVRKPDGSVDFAIATLKDITQQKRLEEELLQAQKMEAIGALAGGIAHDFNNILAAIIGYTELALADAEAGMQSMEDLKEVLKAAFRARDLVQQILTFSRKEKSQKKVMSLYLIIKESLKLLRPSLPATIDIQEDIDPESGFIFADSTKIQQVLVNLCTNALHAMEKEKGVLSVKLSRRELKANDVLGELAISPGIFHELTVSDTGHGIDKNSLNRIFEPFFTTKDLGKGTGMGLSLVHGIVLDLGGMIKVFTEPGKGTTFRVYFPATDNTLAETLEEKREALPTGNERILLVDDEEQVIKPQKTLLEQLGYTVTEHTSSTEALKNFRANPDMFDLIITDQTMPELTGEEMSKEILALRPKTPIILCSGYSSIISEQSAKKIGIKEYLMKPVQIEKLARIVRDLLDSKKLGVT